MKPYFVWSPVRFFGSCSKNVAHLVETMFGLFENFRTKHVCVFAHLQERGRMAGRVSGTTDGKRLLPFNHRFMQNRISRL